MINSRLVQPRHSTAVPVTPSEILDRPPENTTEYSPQDLQGAEEGEEECFDRDCISLKSGYHTASVANNATQAKVNSPTYLGEHSWLHWKNTLRSKPTEIRHNSIVPLLQKTPRNRTLCP